MKDKPKRETQAQRAEQSGVSVSSLYKTRVALRDGIPEIGEAMRNRTLTMHRAHRIARLPRDEQLDVLQGRKQLPKELPRKVIGFIAGFGHAREAAADLAEAAGHRSLAERIRRLMP